MQTKSSLGALWELSGSSLGALWELIAVAGTADLLDKDARIQNMKTFSNWNKDWQQPSNGVGPRGDAVIEERLNKKIWGIKLIYNE